MKLTHALSALPFLGILVGIFFANRTEPFVLGLPFALFWVTLWVLLTARDHGDRLPARPPGRPMNAALAIIIGFVALAIGLGLRARRGHDMDLESWSVGGRGFGTIFIFLLMAGEIYSTFTFLGGAGFVYGSGGAAYYILGYGTLAYVLSYYLLPAVWRYATPRKLRLAGGRVHAARSARARSAWSCRSSPSRR